MGSFESGIEKYKEGKMEESLQIFEKLVKEQPETAKYRQFRARLYSRLGNLQEALQDFDYLLNSFPYDTDYISDRAVVLHLLARNEEALSELDRALNLDPKNPYRYSSRAFLKDRLGDFHGAIYDYEKAIELDPEDAISLNNKGLIEEKLGFKNRSKASFSKADNIIGYQVPEPKKESSGASDSGTQPLFPKIGSTESPIETKVTLASYWKTLKKVFSDPNTRKQFFHFVSKKFKTS